MTVAGIFFSLDHPSNPEYHFPVDSPVESARDGTDMGRTTSRAFLVPTGAGKISLLSLGNGVLPLRPVAVPCRFYGSIVDKWVFWTKIGFGGKFYKNRLQQIFCQG